MSMFGGFGRWPSWGTTRRGNGGAPVTPSSVPSDYALRNWWTASGYDPMTGNWPALDGLAAQTLSQGTAGSRPTKTASNALFGNLPTVDADGVNDTLLVAATGMSLRPFTLGILCRIPAAGAGVYLAGQYFATGYQFFQMNFATDTVNFDPGSPGGPYPAADVASVHLWLFSVDTTGTLQLTTYRDGVSLGQRTYGATASGAGSTFYLFSAGGGYVPASAAEVFTLDQTITADEAASLTEGFRQLGYPL